MSHPSLVPQLARKKQPSFHITKDSTCNNDSSSDESSLEIVPPIRKVTSSLPSKELNQTPQSLLHGGSTRGLDISYSDTDSDDDDDKNNLLTKHVPVFSNNQLVTKRKQNHAQEEEPWKRTRRDATEDQPPHKLREKQGLIRREQAKLDRERRKLQEKLEKAKKKEQDKIDRELQRKQEKEAKRRLNEENQQANGKYAHQEIAVLLDPFLFNCEELGLVEVLKEDFMTHSYPSTFATPKAIQWVRKDYLRGGAVDALNKLREGDENHYEHIQHVAMLLQPPDFIPLLSRKEYEEDVDDYPALEAWLEDMIHCWQTAWKTPKRPKLLLVLQGIPEALDRLWVEYRRNQGAADQSPPTEAELQDAIQWLLIQFQVECVLSPSIEKTHSTIHKLTRALCEAPYVNQVSELECIKKIKTQIAGDDQPLERVQDTWLRQIQQFPRISEAMARNLVQHYPTALSLWQAYQNGDEGTNGCLVASILSGSCRQIKLSESFYRFITSTKPNDTLT